MSIKFRARLGAIEVEFEGEQSFLKMELSNLLTQIVESTKALPATVLDQPVSGGAVRQPADVDHSTNTIASMTDARTGPDLALAAAAHLAFVKGQDRFTRKEILAEMQGATTFYNQNYSSNFSKILGNLTRGKRLNLVGTNTYALPKIVREEFANRLGTEA